MRDSHAKPADEMWLDAAPSTRGDAAARPGGLCGAVSGQRRGVVRPGDAWLASGVPAPGNPDAAAGPVSGGGQRASGSGGADGGIVRTHGGAAAARGFRFDRPVAPGGYGWWYIDAVSDDRQHALTAIFFIGSVFSPYYAWSGRHRPENHCAVNLALHGQDRTCWTMTERGHGALARGPDHLRIGPSSAGWRDGRLICAFNEFTAPIPARVNGQIILEPGTAGAPAALALDPAGRHLWWPAAPRARIDVMFERPKMQWRGDAYYDGNFGTRPPEQDFLGWQWSRTTLAAETAIFYDLHYRDGGAYSLAKAFAAHAAVRDIAAPPPAPLPRGLGGVAGAARSDPGAPPALAARLVDAPFYTRSLLHTRLGGQPAVTVHESLSLNRLTKPWVRLMLPFRMPRWG